MAAQPTIGRLVSLIAWCLAVPAGVVVVYLGLGIALLSVIGEPVRATVVLGVGVVVLAGALRMLRPEVITYRPSPRPSSEIPRFGWHVAGATGSAFLAGQALALWLYARDGSAGFDQAAQARQDAGLVLALMLTLVIAPVAEEMLLRGLIYPLLRRRAGIVASTLITAVVFAALHGNPIQFASVLPLALVLGLVYEQTRRLWPCVAVHLGFNLAAILVPVQIMVAFAAPASVLLLCAASGASTVVLHRRITMGITPTGVNPGQGVHEARPVQP